MHLRATSWDSALEVEHNPFADTPGRHLPPNNHFEEQRSSTNDDHHPLRNLEFASHSQDGDITRPSLFRVLNTDLRSQSNESTSIREPSIPQGGEMVLVHEVRSTDSLAGVALKYGMTIADLRRANHMWANDTIHLHKTLFIPLAKSEKAREIFMEQQPLLLDEDVEKDDHQSQPSTPSASDTSSKSSPHTIRRVSTSKLSYFPPPAKKASRNISQQNAHLQDPLSPSPSPSLSALFSSALPISENIIARLSLDGAPSDRRRSPLTPELDSGHELRDVPSRPSLDGGLERMRPLPGHSRRAATSWEAWHASASGLGQTTPQTTTSSPPGPVRSVRTRQLEPQPDMLVPSSSLTTIHLNSSHQSYKTYSTGDKMDKSLPSPGLRKRDRPSVQGFFEAPDGIEL